MQFQKSNLLAIALCSRIFCVSISFIMLIPIFRKNLFKTVSPVGVIPDPENLYDLYLYWLKMCDIICVPTLESVEQFIRTNSAICGMCVAWFEFIMIENWKIHHGTIISTDRDRSNSWGTEEFFIGNYLWYHEWLVWHGKYGIFNTWSCCENESE